MSLSFLSTLKSGRLQLQLQEERHMSAQVSLYVHTGLVLVLHATALHTSVHGWNDHDNNGMQIEYE